MVFRFNASDDGYVGKAFEKAMKTILERKNADRISAAGRTDFIYNNRYYEVKQNGGVARYAEYDKMFRGSTRIIYATHIAHTLTYVEGGMVDVEIDLANTQFFVLDRQVFIDYLTDTNGLKINESRGTMNIQTMFNYSKNAYHGARGKKLEKWAIDHQLEDDIIEVLFDKIYTED